MLKWNLKLTAILALTALVVLASGLGNFTWHVQHVRHVQHLLNFTW